MSRSGREGPVSSCTLVALLPRGGALIEFSNTAKAGGCTVDSGTCCFILGSFIMSSAGATRINFVADCKEELMFIVSLSTCWGRSAWRVVVLTALRLADLEVLVEREALAEADSEAIALVTRGPLADADLASFGEEEGLPRLAAPS
jgi:hypothetical protein